MILAFIATGIGNFIRTKLIKHHYTLFLNIAASISFRLPGLCTAFEVV